MPKKETGLALAVCRHCGYEFVPRVPNPKKCTACYGRNPLGVVQAVKRAK